jgi:hypothetical protein
MLQLNRARWLHAEISKPAGIATAAWVFRVFMESPASLKWYYSDSCPRLLIKKPTPLHVLTCTASGVSGMKSLLKTRLLGAHQVLDKPRRVVAYGSVRDLQ